MAGTACDRKQLRESNPNPGLLALYYSFDNGDTYFFKRKLLTRTDANIDFNYGNSPPPNTSGIPADRFAVRWVGSIVAPEDGTYTICTCSDDGVRLAIDGQTMIDYWVNQGPRFWWTEKTMEAGKRYDFRMDYYDGGGGAVARLYWARNTGQSPEQVCRNFDDPSAMRGQEECEPGVDIINPDLSIIPSTSFVATEDTSGELLAACTPQRTMLETAPDPSDVNTQKARRLFQRLAGTDPTLFDSRVTQVKNLLAAGKGKEAARIVTQDPNFYQKTVRAMAARISTREERPDVPLNDFIATVIGVTRDRIDARRLLTGDFLYRADPNLFWGDTSIYSDDMLYKTNGHYTMLDDTKLPLACALDKLDRLNLSGIPDHMRQKLVLPNSNAGSTLTGGNDFHPEPAGLLSSRAYAEAHYIAGTGRRIIEKSFEHFLCAPIDTWRDAELSDVNVGRDVERFPNGPASHNDYLNTCKSCHGPMDSMRGAFAQYHFENGYIKFAPYFVQNNRENNTANAETLNRMKLSPSCQETDTNCGVNTNPKIAIAWKLNHNVNYADGKFTSGDAFDNLLVTARHGVRFGWSGATSGNGPREYARMLANSRAFPSCMARRVYAEVCRDDPFASTFPTDMATWLDGVSEEFANRGYDLKDLFETVALGCLE
jgi:hypothetical protein